MSRLEKLVTHEDFVYYLDNSLAFDKEDDYLPIIDSNYEAREDASVSSGSWRCIDSQAINIGEILRQVYWSDNLGDLKGKRPRLCTVINQLVYPKVQKL